MDKGIDSTAKLPEFKYQYLPKNILLKTFVESHPKQYITSSSRPQKNKLQIIFNQKLDTLSFLPTPSPSPYPQALSLKPVSLDSLSLWLTDSSLFNRDTVRYIVNYTAYDSLEQPTPTTDTITFSFRPIPPKPGDKNPFQITTNFNRTMELGATPTLTFSEPWKSMDTSKIQLYKTRDTLKTEKPFKLLPSENMNESPTGVLVIPDFDPGLDSTGTILKSILSADFHSDSTYALQLLPGAFTTYTGLTNDSLKVAFRVAKPDQYGSVKLTIEGLNEAAIVQLIKGKDQVLSEKRIDSAGVLHYEYLKSGKYKFKLIYDSNQNGQWDTGRYLKKIQPERILLYGKELDVKANWELEEVWNLSGE